MSKWQPIETAPKDGSCLLLWLPDSATDTIVFGHWDSDFGGCWYERHGSESAFPIDVEVTHWQPLPEPPAA